MKLTNKKETSFISSKTKHIQSLFLFLIFPLTQIILLFLIAQEINALYSLPAPAYYSILITFSFLLVLGIFFFHKYLSKMTTQRKYAELSHLQAYQKEHYKHIQVQREHLTLFKNNFHKQIIYLSDLLSNNQGKQALSLLNTLTEQVNSTKEYPFCPSSIINAILSDKETECRLSSITFQADLQIGTCETISPPYLCSIFSNLLDNAINACQKIDNVSEKYIHLTARQSGDFLHIKVRNSSLVPETPKEGHGYGQKILKDIAEKYHGQFKTHYEKQTYEAYFSIQLPE